MSGDTYEKDHDRTERMAGAAATDTQRPARIGRMLASSVAKHRAYAHRLLARMGFEDRERALMAYRQIPFEVRQECDREDDSPEGMAARDELDVEEAAYRRNLGDMAPGRLISIGPDSPYRLSEYLRLWTEARGPKPPPLEPGEHERIHGEIVQAMRARDEGGRDA